VFGLVIIKKSNWQLFGPVYEKKVPEKQLNSSDG
jgi:hypothetical protein